MGRSSDPPPSYRDDPEAVSLHTTPDDYAYDDAPEISGLPPSYTDSEAGNSSTALPEIPIRHYLPPTARTNHNKPSFKNGKPVVASTVNVLDPRYDTNPSELESAIRTFANDAPVPLIYIMGTHNETVKKGDKKTTQVITDFRLAINLQRYLYPNFHEHDASRMSLTTVENSEKTHRGTILKCRAPGSKQDIEVGGAPKPGLTEWCHRYCASSRLLRIFRLRRVVTGLDEEFLQNRIYGHIRATNYRGHISVTFPVEDRNVDFYTSSKVNAWRLTTWVRWIFYLTFLWIFSWPILFFATRRYAVVNAEWPFSTTDSQRGKQYTTISEEEWVSKWWLAIRRLVLDRFEGEATEVIMTGAMRRDADPPMPGRIRTGHAGVDSAVGVLSEGIRVAREVISAGEIQEGWGYDF